MKKHERQLVRVMPDFTAVCGIWMDGHCVVYPVERLGISQSLEQELRQWIQDFETSTTGKGTFPYEAFSARGRKLAEKLRGQLGADYAVWYWDEARYVNGLRPISDEIKVGYQVSTPRRKEDRIEGRPFPLEPLSKKTAKLCDLFDAYERKFGEGPRWNFPDPSTEFARVDEAIRTGVPIHEEFPPGFIPA